MTDDASFWNKLARRYARRPIGNIAAYEQTLEQVRGYLSPDHSVLEIGCGTGTTALKLAPSVRHLTASDVSSEMIAIAGEKARDQDIGNVQFVTSGDVGEQVKDGSLDVVLAFNLLHLLRDVPGTARRIHAVLKPGGLFLSKTPCLGEMTVLLRLLLPMMRFIGKAPYATYPTRATLEADLRGAGFEILDARTFEGAAKTWFIAARKI